MKIAVLDIGPFLLDGGSIFGVVPKSLWGKYFEVDRNNNIKLGLNSVLIEDGNRKIIVDAGIPSSSEILKEKLKSLKITCEEITDVVFTHLHYDHCGGAFEKRYDTVVPVFPNASIYVNENELEDALNPDERTAKFYKSEIVSFISRWPDLKTFSHSAKLTDNVEVLHAPGHTAGHSVVVAYDDRMHLIAGDMFPTMYHFKKPHYMTAFDENLRQNLKIKKYFLEMLSKRKSAVYFYHDSKNPFLTV